MVEQRLINRMPCSLGVESRGHERYRSVMNSGSARRSALHIRRAVPKDRQRVLELCALSLGWDPDGPNADFFAWKHDHNPFGVSPAWLAESESGDLVGVRVLLRWEFRGPLGEVIKMVRAVDTATHPDWQGQGIFTKLTLGALDDVQGEGVRGVFNTPNDQSRPGYLKMGWVPVARVPVAMRPRSIRSLPRVLQARTSASKWSERCEVGCGIEEALESFPVDSELISSATGNGISTNYSPEYLRWRYSFGPLQYRAVLVGRNGEDGMVVFRVRRRGAALEATICETFVSDPRQLERATKSILQETKADYALVSSTLAGPRSFMLRTQRVGPMLVWRDLSEQPVPTINELHLSLGDIELY